MNDLEKMVMEEISTLDEMRLIDVLGFIRFIKAEKRSKGHALIEGWLDQARKSVHQRSEELGITPAAIERQLQERRKRE